MGVPQRNLDKAVDDPLASQLIEHLQEENDILREQVRQLQDQIASTTTPMPIEFCLTPAEDKVLRYLLGREGVCHRERIFDFCNSDRLNADLPDIKIIDVYICKIRKKIEPFGVQIVTHFGFGFSLPHQSKEIIRKMQNEQYPRTTST